jgi:hypothetical protein
MQTQRERVCVWMTRTIAIMNGMNAAAGKEGWELVATDSQRPDMSSKNVVYMKRRRMVYSHPLKSSCNEEEVYPDRPFSPKPLGSPENGHHCR